MKKQCSYSLSFIILCLLTTILNLERIHCDPSPPYWGGSNPQYFIRVNMTNPKPVAYW